MLPSLTYFKKPLSLLAYIKTLNILIQHYGKVFPQRGCKPGKVIKSGDTKFADQHLRATENKGLFLSWDQAGHCKAGRAGRAVPPAKKTSLVTKGERRPTTTASHYLSLPSLNQGRDIEKPGGLSICLQRLLLFLQ